MLHGFNDSSHYKHIFQVALFYFFFTIKIFLLSKRREIMQVLRIKLFAAQDEQRVSPIREALALVSQWIPACGPPTVYLTVLGLS